MGEQVMGNRLLASCVAAGALCVGSVSGAHAAEEGFYFGIMGGQSSADLSKNELDAGFGGIADAFAAELDLTASDLDSTLDDSDAAWGLHIGYQWGAHVGAEIGYVDLGEAYYDGAALLTDPIPPATPVGILGLPAFFRANGFTAAVLGILPLGERFDLHARGGILFARNRTTIRFTDFETGEVLGSGEVRGNSKDFFVGLGAAWNINPDYSVRFEYQRFLDVGDDEENLLEYDIDLISLNLLFR
jgi:hypothetical protein